MGGRVEEMMVFLFLFLASIKALRWRCVASAGQFGHKPFLCIHYCCWCYSSFPAKDQGTIVGLGYLDHSLHFLYTAVHFCIEFRKLKTCEPFDVLGSHLCLESRDSTRFAYKLALDFIKRKVGRQ